MSHAMALNPPAESMEQWETSAHRPVAMGSMSRAALDAALAKGMASRETGRGMSPDEVDAALRQEFGA